jgi:ubiquinone/menaquinone biosynthesis C-methylase UbiE
MEPKLQRRIQRYGWDLAVDRYETLWQAQLAPAQTKLLACAALAPGERVLDVACGTGLVTFEAARAVGETGSVLGVDISGEMIDAARERTRQLRLTNVELARMDAETLALPEASFDVALCALGLMYAPSPMQAIREMRRVLRPGGRVALAVWGERARCGWSPVFPIVDAEVSTEVCPLFFQLGQQDSLAELCAQAGFEGIENHRLATTLTYRDASAACDAAFVGGPVALAWSRFDAETRARVRARYADAIAQWRVGEGYAMPGEFVVTAAVVPPDQRSSS